MYIASVGFAFADETFTWEPAHWLDNAEIHPFQEGFEPNTGFYGTVWRSGADNAQGESCLLLSKEAGWVGADPNPVLSPLPGSGRVGLTGRTNTALPVPAGATSLRIFDSRGRLTWETRVLPRASQVTLPVGLSQGPRLYRWTR